MPTILSRFVMLALAGMALSVLPRATPSTAAERPAQPSLQGQLLIATEAIGDPRFDHAVILMVRHDRDGAVGIVINHPIGERPLADILAALGAKDAAAPGSVRIFLGGPVRPQVGFVIHGTDYNRAETRVVDDRFATTSSLEVLRDIATKNGPAKSLVAFGYAGWAAGQLEDELADRAWYVAPADPELVFDADRGKVWERAVARRTRRICDRPSQMRWITGRRRERSGGGNRSLPAHPSVLTTRPGARS
jgi:putative transcriptional regulator